MALFLPIVIKDISPFFCCTVPTRYSHRHSTLLCR